MAVSWGSWEYSGGNGMRVGLDVSWETITHGEAVATCTIEIWTENQFTYSDGQQVNYSDSLDNNEEGRSNQSYTNNDGGSPQLRDTVTYDYTYGSSSYGSSPGTRTFTATVSGAYNGVTPSKTVTSNIPARPYAAPAPPTSGEVARVSATSNKVTWINNHEVGEPWTTVRTVRSTSGGSYSTVGTGGYTATSFTDTVAVNGKYQYAVRAENSIGNSAYDYTSVIYTDPDPPTSPLRVNGTGDDQDLSWVNKTGYTEYTTEIWRSEGGGAYALLTSVATGVTTYTDTTATAGIATKYKFRHATSAGIQGTLYSAYSAETDASAGVTSAPSAPTNLVPTNSNIIKPSVINTFTWQHNPTDGTAQTKYQIEWRLQGAGSWTNSLTEVTSGVSAWSPAASTFPDNSTIEWHVRTKGADATASAYSATATFKTVDDPNAAREYKRVMRLNVSTGLPETATTGVLPPIGSIEFFAGATAPAGWLFCDGASVLRADYPDLFGVIGTTFGSVDGTHFTLPELERSDTGWISAATGWTLAANWTTATYRYRIVNDGITRMASVYFDVDRSTSTINQPTNGNASNTTIFSAIPTAIRPAQTVYATSGGSGRGAFYTIGTGGTVTINAFTGTTDLAIGETVSCYACYMLD